MGCLNVVLILFYYFEIYSELYYGKVGCVDGKNIYWVKFRCLSG